MKYAFDIGIAGENRSEGVLHYNADPQVWPGLFQEC
jgi:hypothetical protein